MKSVPFFNSKNKPKIDTSVTNLCKFNIEKPTNSQIHEKELLIRGWIIPLDFRQVKSIRALNNKKIHKLTYGITRKDVYNAYPNLNKELSLYSGFTGEFEFEEGELIIQVNFGEGYHNLLKMEIEYFPEQLFENRINKGLAEKSVEHEVLLESKQIYYFEDQKTPPFKRSEDDPRLIAFYLPQFHPIKENDLAWGKGFTEWRNVATGKPRFVGHQQPYLPRDLGFYDLRLEETIKDQVELAKHHGIYAFCFYYYWFSGYQLLSKPLETFLKRKEWDFNFMICWANENWTKRWDGRDKEVIVAQKYLKDDPLNFIKDIEHILLDPRYVRVDGKPLMGVYRGPDLENPNRYVSVWRKYFKEKHGLELEIITTLHFDGSDPRSLGMDAGIEFAPHVDIRRGDFDRSKFEIQGSRRLLLDNNFRGLVLDYRCHLMFECEKNYFDFPTYKCLAPSWDNDSRKKGKGSMVMYGANPDLYTELLDRILDTETKKQKSPIVFINAWNEWAEGTTLEPTLHYGNSILLRTSEVLAKHSNNRINSQNYPMFGISRSDNCELAVVVHIFYRNEWKYIEKRIKRSLAGIKHDLFITLTLKDASLADEIKEKYPNAQIKIVPNRGRDVLPFIFIANRLKAAGYKYLLKLHTKRSPHLLNGNLWFKELVDNLLPNKKLVDQTLKLLSKDVAIIGPINHFISLKEFIGKNEELMKEQLSRILNYTYESSVFEDNNLGFFSGTMFWCRLDSLRWLIDLKFIPEDFESEKGQIDATLAHALERLFTVIPLLEGLKVYELDEEKKLINPAKINRNYVYAKKG